MLPIDSMWDFAHLEYKEAREYLFSSDLTDVERRRWIRYWMDVQYWLSPPPLNKYKNNNYVENQLKRLEEYGKDVKGKR